nr:MAG TPA: hypothetical protein [Caudoviricetes sp.]
MVPRRRARKKHNAKLTHTRTPAARRGKYRHIAGLAWFAVCCTAWYGSITRAHRCTGAPLLYIIIIGGCPALYSVRCGGGIWYRWRCYA